MIEVKYTAAFLYWPFAGAGERAVWEQILGVELLVQLPSPSSRLREPRSPAELADAEPRERARSVGGKGGDV